MIDQKVCQRGRRDCRNRVERLRQAQNYALFGPSCLLRDQAGYCWANNSRSRRCHCHKNQQQRNGVREAERHQPDQSEEESGPRQICFSQCFYQASNQPALQNYAEQAKKCINVAHLLHSESLAVPGVTSLREEREPRHEHREGKGEREELPEQRTQVRLAKIADVVSPIE